MVKETDSKSVGFYSEQVWTCQRIFQLLRMSDITVLYGQIMWLSNKVRNYSNETNEKKYNFILRHMERIYYFISINGGRSQSTKYSCGRSQITKYSCGRSQITRQIKRKKLQKKQIMALWLRLEWERRRQTRLCYQFAEPPLMRRQDQRHLLRLPPRPRPRPRRQEE